MKKLFILLIIPFVLSCKSDSVNNSNEFIPNVSFGITINTTLPSYQSLQFASNSLKINQPNVGVRGIIVINTGSGFLAYDGACPNQALSSCSELTVSGINATCPCDSAVYNLFTGQSPGKQFPLKAYRVEVVGTNITVSN